MSDYSGSKDRRQWHLDKSVSVGHLLTTVTMILCFAAYLSRMDSRIAVLEAHDQNLAEAVKAVADDTEKNRIQFTAAVESSRLETKDDLRRIEKKLDDLARRQGVDRND